MRNLLKQTIAHLSEEGKLLGDVAWVGSADGKLAITWAQFAEIADVNYDQSYGSQRIADDLVVVLNDGSWLERHEYDGSEWWEYKTTPMKQAGPKRFKSVKVGMNWGSLVDIQETDG